MFSERFKRGFRTVGFRISLWHSLSFVLGAGLVFGVAYFFLRHSVDEQSQDTIEFRLNQFAAEYERGGTEGVIELCKLRRGRAQKAFFVRLADEKNGTIFLRDPDDWTEFQPSRLEARPLPEEVEWIDLEGTEGSLLRLSSMRMPDGKLLQVGRTTEFNRDLLDRFRIVLIGIAAIVIVAGAVGGIFAALRALRPVHQLTATVRSILDTGKFAARVPSRGTRDEIDELVECFNAMLQKIQVLIRGMRDSLDNVAHDLRTPMTRLRNIATKALEQNYGQEEAHEALSDCLEESERVLTMLTTLMDIAEAETGVMKLDYREVNLAQLIAQVIDLYQPVAEEKQITVSVHASPDLQVRADGGRLRRALGNLLDNAIKYSPEGGKVEVSAFRQAEMVSISIADSGEGVPSGELERIWERLYRVDKSRSQRGLGLGLSFVKAIVEAHHGKVGVESRPERGSRFSIELPMAGRSALGIAPEGEKTG